MLRHIIKTSSKTFSIIVAICFIAIFGLVGIDLLTGSRAATNCTLSATLVDPCRPLIGAAAHGNPGALSDGASQFTYLENLIGNSMDVYRDYHAPLGTPGNSNATLPADPNTPAGQAEINIANMPN